MLRKCYELILSVMAHCRIEEGRSRVAGTAERIARVDAPGTASRAAQAGDAAPIQTFLAILL